MLQTPLQNRSHNCMTQSITFKLFLYTTRQNYMCAFFEPVEGKNVEMRFLNALSVLEYF